MATQNPMSQQRFSGRQGSASEYQNLTPAAAHAQTKAHQFGTVPVPGSAEFVLIDLTGPSQSNDSGRLPLPTAIVPATSLAVGPATNADDRMDVNAAAEGGTANGNAMDELPRARNAILNSRRKRHYGMGTQTAAHSQPSSSFVNPSSIQPASRGPATPTLPRGAGNARQRQFKPQPAKPSTSASKRDNRLKPYILETPSVAPLLPHQKHSDFFPWKGNHPEDEVTEIQAKSGQYDKLLPSKNEHQTGRPTLYPAFKQKSGLSTLASLFLAVLEKKQDYGRITSQSTFRLPPRVILADHKRESWLRDLANSLVPLRRLSRTIPHGIRGRILLDHCSSKNIPPSRAIWLARCVGANELRGLKRKGASNNLAFGNVEAKWIKDWTIQVVQFIDRAASECGQTSDASWKNKMVYAIRLSAHLYSENLLDRSTFLEWYLSFLETPSLDTLPLGLLMSSIYWKDLLRTRRFGHRFAEALLAKAQAILESEDGEIYLPLLRRLFVLITEILLGHMESLVMPKTWGRYRATLESCVDRTDPSVEARLRLVIRRNDNLCSPAETKRDIVPTSPQRRMIEILDSASMPYDLDGLASACLNFLPDYGEFIQCLCEWAVTSLRVGVYRVYIAVAILRQKASSGLDIRNPILAFLERFVRGAIGDKSKVYLLISELVHTRNFALGAYCRWLISRGILAPFTTMEKGHPCHVRLLAEIPTSAASRDVRNLRNNLLNGIGFSVVTEAKTLEDVRNLLCLRIGGILGKQYPPPLPSAKFEASELEVLRGISRHLICEISSWIKDSVRKHVVVGAPVGRDNWRDLSIEVGISAITLSQFTMIRRVLEEWEDFVVLADVLKQVTSSDISGVLSSVADTVCHHIEVFSVLGVVKGILQSLFQRYKKLQLRRSIEKFVVVSMLELASFPCCDQEIRKQLQHDLDTYEQRYPRASFAHSPLSDAEFLNIMNDGDGDCSGELDRLLQSGASIDKQTLSRIFDAMVMRIQSCLDENISHPRFAFSSLIKLRQFDPVSFDKLTQGWVARLFQSPSRHSLLDALSPLIAGSCLDLAELVRSALEVLDPISVKEKLSGSPALELAIQVLNLIVGSSLDQSQLTDQEIYSFKRKRQTFEQKAPLDLLGIIYRSIELCVTDGNYEAESRIRNLIVSKPIIHRLRYLSTADREVLITQLLDPLSKDSQPALLKWLRLLIDHLLDDHDLNDLPDPDADVQVSRLLQLANDFSIQLCQLKMRIIFDSEKSRPCFENGMSTLTQTFFRGIASAFKEKGSIWSELVSVLDENCARQVRFHAEELFLQSMSFPVPLETSQNRESLARALLAVIEATSTNMIHQFTPTVSSALAEKLYMLAQYIMPPNEGSSEVVTNTEVPSSSDLLLELRPWLILFLRIIILNKSAFSNSKIGVSEQAGIVVGLCALLQSDNIQSDEALFDHILDVASFLVDGLPDETRQMIRRHLRCKKQSPRVCYLLGSPDLGSGDWLKAQTRSAKLIDFPIKSWERLADPTPTIGENDTSLSLTLFRARKVKCLKAENEKNTV